jgi:hypothetical protein
LSVDGSGRSDAQTLIMVGPRADSLDGWTALRFVIDTGMHDVAETDVTASSSPQAREDCCT